MQIKISFGSGPNRPQREVPRKETAGRSGGGSSAAEAAVRPTGRGTSSGNREAEVLAELDALVGLEGVKQLLKELRAYAQIQKKRAQNQLPAENLVLHMVFRGNPGTGKTTVARIVGQLFKEMQILPKGHLVEVERADLVGEYVGHTAQKTREQVKKALGGVLFIDEAYSLVRGGGKDFGREAIDVLVRAMENYRDQFALIMAGYREEMDGFIHANPGLKSRFALYLDFPDYDVPQMVKIGKQMLAARQYILEPEAAVRLEKMLRRYVLSGEAQHGNARLVRNLIEAAIRRQALRLVNRPHLTREDLMLLRVEDLPAGVGQERGLELAGPEKARQARLIQSTEPGGERRIGEEFISRLVAADRD